MRGVIDRTGPARVSLDLPVTEALPREVERLGCRRVMCLVSDSLRTTTDEITRLEEALDDRHAVTFSGVHAHTPIADVLSAIEVARDSRADLVVTVGGGALTDAGKDIALGLRADVRSMDDVERWRELYRWGKGESAAETAPEVKVICVPTTLSGGEHNCVGGAWHPELGKFGLEHRANIPEVVIYDPALVRHTPLWLWLSTGVRAVDHAVETLSSEFSNPYYDAVAETALRMLVDGLTRAARDPEDLAARTLCQVGAWQAIVPLVGGVPMGLSHAMSHALGGVGKVPHGHTSCVLLPGVVEWNAEVLGDRARRVAAALGDADAPAHEQLDRLIRTLGQPRDLADVGIRSEPEVLERIVELTLSNPFCPTNPRPVRGPEDVRAVLATMAASHRS